MQPNLYMLFGLEHLRVKGGNSKDAKGGNFNPLRELGQVRSIMFGDDVHRGDVSTRARSIVAQRSTTFGILCFMNVSGCKFTRITIFRKATT
jgi:hypothetical protein